MYIYVIRYNKNSYICNIEIIFQSVLNAIVIDYDNCNYVNLNILLLNYKTWWVVEILQYIKEKEKLLYL